MKIFYLKSIGEYLLQTAHRDFTMYVKDISMKSVFKITESFK